MIFLWIILYGLIFELSGENPYVMIGYTVTLLLWLYKTNRFTRIGINKAKIEPPKVVFLIPVIIIPLLNLLISKGIQLEFSFVILMFTVAIVEEIFFRGFLFHSLLRLGQCKAIIISSIFFGMFHFANYYQTENMVQVCLQVVFAFAMGIYYAVLTIQTKSIIPCMLSHFLINITGA